MSTTPSSEPTPCPDCPESLGYTPEYFALNKHVGPLMWDWSKGNNDNYKKITTFLCGRAPRGLGHDTMDAYKATEKLGILAGLPRDWSTCKTCSGSGELL
jgi:hypothetical protein